MFVFPRRPSMRTLVIALALVASSAPDSLAEPILVDPAPVVPAPVPVPVAPAPVVPAPAVPAPAVPTPAVPTPAVLQTPVSPPPVPGFDAQLTSAMHAKDGSLTLVGRSGQLYQSSGDLQWQRTDRGGVSVTVSRVFRSGAGKLYAVGDRAPLFARQGEALWAGYSLVRKGSAAASRDGAKIIALRRQLFELGATGWRSIAKAPATVRHLWAPTSRHFFIADADGNIWSSRGGGWQRIAITLRPGERIAELRGLPKRFAVARTNQGRLFALEKKTAKLIPAGAIGSDVVVEAIGVANGELLAVARDNSDALLVKVNLTGLTKVDELWQPPLSDQFALIAAHKGGLFIATSAGQARIRREDKTWANAEVLAASPNLQSFPNSGPALAR